MKLAMNFATSGETSFPRSRATGFAPRRAAKLALVAIAAAIFLAGCSSQLPPTHYYVLELEPPAGAGGAASAGASSSATSAPGVAVVHGGAGAAAAEDPHAWTLGVRPFAVDSPYDQDRIVYRVGEGSAEVGFYAYHLWAAPLDSMLAAAVATGLLGTAHTNAVEPVVAGRRYQAYLDGRVLAIEEIDVGDRQQVRVEIELRLVDPKGAELWSDVVTARGETRTDQVGQVVDALADALAQALAGTRQRLGAALSTLVS